MERANPLVLLAGLVVIFLVWAGPGWFMDGIYIAKHEGDAVHLLDIVLRMAAGQVPHLDFLTPIGGMAFEPIVWFMGPERGAGHAFVLAQVAVLAALLPAVFWVGVSRLSTIQALGFALVIAVLVAAYVHGESEPTLSVSMHYNRWSWAVAFIAIALAVLPPRDVSFPVLDGLLIGLAFGLLALTKVTYAVGFFVPVLVALILRRDWLAIAMALLAGLALLGVYTLVFGVNYWFGYIHDLAAVATSEVRSNPGRAFGAVIAAPAFLGASLTLLAAVIALRQAKVMQAGLTLFLLVPGFFYVTYQNFGNDPQWLYLLPIALFALRPEIEVRNGFGWDMRQVLTLLSVIAMALAAPSFFNLAYSPFRHINAERERYTPLITDAKLNGDVFTTSGRAYAVRQAWDMMTPDSPFGRYAAYLEPPVDQDAEPDQEEEARSAPVVVLGETFPDCSLSDGLVAYFDAVAQELEDAGYAGKRVLQTDLFSTIHWVYGDFPPLRRGAPWSYGTLAGVEDAEYLLVPLCPMHAPSRQLMTAELAERPDLTLTYETRTPLFVLYRVSGG